MSTLPLPQLQIPPAQAAAVAEGRIIFHKRRTFAWKTIILAIVTLAFVPVLLYKSTWGATVYVWGLIIIHVISIFTFAIGIKKEDIAPTKKGLWGRLAGLIFAFFLLGLAEKGLHGEDSPEATMASAIFWWSLFAVWAIHTAGLALLHLRGKKEQACIFAGDETVENKS